MKGIDIFCASQAATSICLSMEELVSSSSSSSSAIQLGSGNISCSRLIDRYNPVIRDSRRVGGSDRIDGPLPPHSSYSRRSTGSRGCDGPLPPYSSSDSRRITDDSGRNGPLQPCSSDSRRNIGGSGRTIGSLPPHSCDSRRSFSSSGRDGPLPSYSSSDSRRITDGSGRDGPLQPCSSDSRRNTGGSETLPPNSSQQPISSKSKNNNNKNSTTTSKPSKETKKKRSTSSWSCTRPSEFITPPSSTRYLLNEKELLDVLSHDYNDPILKLVPSSSSSSSSLVKSKSCKDVMKVAADESWNPSKPPSSTSSGNQVLSHLHQQRPKNCPVVDDMFEKEEVVVLRVSLHCKGCEKKMRKHLSRMEGVTSFNIDFAAKKVTVIGDVTPIGVLASISKVKNAQLWPVPTVASDGKLQNISQNSLAIHLL